MLNFGTRYHFYPCEDYLFTKADWPSTDKFGTDTNFIRAVPKIERCVNGPLIILTHQAASNSVGIKLFPGFLLLLVKQPGRQHT
jgi:hypothetical protein